MLNIKKAITVSEISLNNFVFLSLIIMFCWLGNLYAQMPGGFPEGIEFDPRHLLERGERVSPSSEGKDVELVSTLEVVVYATIVHLKHLGGYSNEKSVYS